MSRKWQKPQRMHPARWTYHWWLERSNGIGNDQSPAVPAPETYYILDNDGNYLTDDSGNRLIFDPAD